MKAQEAEQVYLHNVERTEALLNSIGKNPQAINAFITNTYAALSQTNAAFLWFSLGTIVSGTVGKNLQVSMQMIIHSAGQIDFAKIALENFSDGNQAIFKDILPLFLTYESIGVEGIGILASSGIDNPFKNDFVLNAMKGYSQLKIQQSTIANSLGLPLNDSQVIAQLFSDEKSVKLAHSIAMSIAKEEQEVVDDMYEKELVDIMLHPQLAWLGHQIKLDEIKILDKSYNFFDYIDNPADYDQRLHFAEILLAAIEDGISNGEFLKIQSDVHKMAEHALWIANPNTAHNAIGETNGVFWAQQAEAHDKAVKDSVLAFINNDPQQPQQQIAKNIIDDQNDQNIFPSILDSEHESVKISMDPLALLLEANLNPAVLDALSHINWSNPNWSELIYQTQIEALQNAWKEYNPNKFMNAAVGSTTPSHYDIFSSHGALKLSDAFHNDSNNIDFSNISGTESNTSSQLDNIAITSMELANGTVLEVNNQGNAGWVNCNSSAAVQLEYAANAMLHYM